MTIKFKTKPKKKTKTAPLNVHILIDSSASMHGHEKSAINLLNDILDQHRNAGDDRVLSITSFDSNEKVICRNVQASLIDDLDSDSYEAKGPNTKLTDSIGRIIQNNYHIPGAHLLLVVTDGQDNASHAYTEMGVRKQIRDAIATDKWTIAVAGPIGCTNEMQTRYGILPGCITEWETTTEGWKQVTRTIRTANVAYNTAYRAGKTSLSSYLSPNVQDLTTTEVRKNLTQVTSKYQTYTVSNAQNGVTVSDFVTKKGKKFTPGILYYELTKREEIQDYKNIILMNNTSKDLFTGPDVRDLINLPKTGTFKIDPAWSTKFTVFIRSTSFNRKLVGGSKVLIEK